MGIAKVLILKGDGINCERELGDAFLEAGGDVTYVHINDLLATPKSLHSFDILGLPGGFSFGDELRSGKVLAMKLKHHLGGELIKFVSEQKLIIGICNGFQALVQLNAFQDFSEERHYTLAENIHGEFRNFWTEVKVAKNNSPWLANIDGNFFLPVRHKEGRLLGEIPKEQKLLSYLEDINGSIDNTAGIIDRTGNILGMMPHPEAALNSYLYPFGDPTDKEVLNNIRKVKAIFTNAIMYSNRRKA